MQSLKEGQGGCSREDKREVVEMRLQQGAAHVGLHPVLEHAPTTPTPRPQKRMNPASQPGKRDHRERETTCCKSKGKVFQD